MDTPHTADTVEVTIHEDDTGDPFWITARDPDLDRGRPVATIRRATFDQFQSAARAIADIVAVAVEATGRYEWGAITPAPCPEWDGFTSRGFGEPPRRGCCDRCGWPASAHVPATVLDPDGTP